MSQAITALGSFLPHGIAFNAGGDLAVTDQTNNRVLLLHKGASSPLEIVGGSSPVCGGVSVHNPFGIAFDGTGSIAIADNLHNRVVFCNLGTGSSTIFNGTATSGLTPRGLAFDLAGNLAVSDAANSRVVLLSPGIATGAVTTIAGSAFGGASGDGGPATSAQLYFPSGLAFDAANGLAISDSVSGP